MNEFLLGIVSSIESLTNCNIGAIRIYDNSEGNVLGNVSFEGNRADDSGGEGKFEDALSVIPT